MPDPRWVALLVVGLALTASSESGAGADQDSKLVSPTDSYCGPDECFNVTSANDTNVTEGNNVTDSVLIMDSSDAYLASSTLSNPETTVTQSASTKTVVITSPTASTTEATIPPPSRSERKLQNEDPCSCDVKYGFCDINCCCDDDCSESDRKAFSGCIPETTVGHSGLCYKQQFIYSNNTRYKVIQEESGIFCISRDNFPERMFFSNQKIIRTTSSFNRAMKRKQQFQWPQQYLGQNEKMDSTKMYRSGDAIWVYNNLTNTLSTLAIPLSSGTTFCRSSKTVRYLEEFQSQCLHLSVSKERCSNYSQSNLNAQLFCENVALVSSPLLVNQTKIEESPDDAFVDLKKVVCYGNDSECSEINQMNAPSYDQESDSCINVMTSVTYVIYHNSSNGIVEAECRIGLDSVGLGRNFNQEFLVTFRWAKNDSNSFQRSGMPGYLRGFPLISGNLIDRSSDPGRRESVNMSHSSRDWFSIPVADKTGTCSGMTNVLFKENMRTQCNLNVSRDALLSQEGCNSIKDQVWKMIFGGMKLNQSDPRQLQTFVSSFGDPAPNVPAEWVPIFFDRSPVSEQPIQAPCPTQVAGVQYKVLYSYFGPFSSPQMKIVGFHASLSTSNVVCKVHGCRLKIVSSVSFLDVSQQAVNKFAKAPIVKIRLPTDFFYPFSSSSCGQLPKNYFLMCLTVTLLKIMSRVEV